MAEKLNESVTFVLETNILAIRLSVYVQRRNIVLKTFDHKSHVLYGSFH